MIPSIFMDTRTFSLYGKYIYFGIKKIIIKTDDGERSKYDKRKVSKTTLTMEIFVVDQQNEFNYHYMPRQINRRKTLTSVTFNEI